MKKLYPKKWWIEIEVWLVNKNKYPVFPINGEKETAYEKLVYQLWSDKDLVKPEVINNMVEIVTGVHNSIDNAWKEIFQLLNMCKQKTKEIWLNSSNIPWIKIDRNNIKPEQLIDCCVTDKDYYKAATNEIIQVLQDPYDLLGAGTLATHIHMSAENDEATFELFKSISNYAKKVWQWWMTPEKMLMNRKRFLQWNKIIEARKQLGHLVNGIDPFEIPDNYMEYIEKNLFDENWNLKRMHNIIALKKPWDKYTVELRSPDGVITADQLQTTIEFTKSFVKEALDDWSR